MNYNRWYDKYPNLKKLLILLESVDDYNIEIIAQDFLQIIMSKYQEKFDIFIQNMSHNVLPGYNRWYDKNYNLHTCIEFLKVLDDVEKEDLINSFILSIMSFITNVDNE